MDIGIKKSNGMPEGWVLGLYNDGHVMFKEVHEALHRYFRYREVDEMISYWCHNRETEQRGMWIPLDVIIRNGTEAIEVGLLLYTEETEKEVEIGNILKSVLSKEIFKRVL